MEILHNMALAIWWMLHSPLVLVPLAVGIAILLAKIFDRILAFTINLNRFRER
jgi:hypothetical protein